MYMNLQSTAVNCWKQLSNRMFQFDTWSDAVDSSSEAADGALLIIIRYLYNPGAEHAFTD
jgi:hypothetical protein